MLATTVLAMVMGLDAFTLAMGIGFRGIRLKWVALLGTTVGAFHAGMPLLGMWLGHLLGDLLGHAATYAGASLFLLLGAHMLHTAWFASPDRVRNPFTPLGILAFAFGVSLDTFSAGISLGLLANHILVTVALFGFFGGLATVLGLLIGRHLAGWLGRYGEMLGGVVLILWGLRFIL